MQKSSFEDIFEHLFESINFYTDLLVNLEEGGVVRKDEKAEIYEAMVLKVYVTWEIFAEELMVACLNRDTSKYAKHKAMALPKNLTKDICSCLINGLNYFDFRSTGEIKGIARKILPQKYNPFEVILKDDRDKIDELSQMRNYIAHKSQKSRNALLKMYKDNYGFSRFREPGPFLLAFDRPKHQRFANYIDAFNSAAMDMATHLGV